MDVVEINISSGKELDPVSSPSPDFVRRHLVSQSSHRSAEAKSRRNKKRHEKQQQQCKNHPLRRQVHPSWSIPQIKNFLHKSNIPFGYINPRRGTIITILFRNEGQRQYANTQLSDDIFDESHYKQWIVVEHS